MNAASPLIADDSTQRFVAGFVTSAIASYGATACTLALLTTFLWWWLAALAALCVGAAAGFIAGQYALTDGYDRAVSACAWLKTRFAR